MAHAADAIVSATTAISSGVASTLPWPIAVEPTASGESISAAGGIVEVAAPASVGTSLKPNRSAAATSRFAPSFTPSGANTELHDLAKLSANDPPHDSPFAFWRSTPSITAFVSTGNETSVFTIRASRAAVAVMILNVEPGGWGAENAIPRAPARGRCPGRAPRCRRSVPPAP